MTSRRSLWRWALYASVVLLMAGTVLAWTAESTAVQNVGIGLFVASAVVYAVARLATTFGGRAR